jgi:hypothetical protein
MGASPLPENTNIFSGPVSREEVLAPSLLSLRPFVDISCSPLNTFLD